MTAALSIGVIVMLTQRKIRTGMLVHYGTVGDRNVNSLSLSSSVNQLFLWGYVTDREDSQGKDRLGFLVSVSLHQCWV